jgi:MGT family glycosyltransferase
MLFFVSFSLRFRLVWWIHLLCAIVNIRKMVKEKKIAFFPEAAYGPALNSVGIAQACEKLGHKSVFLTAPDMAGVYAGYGFEEHVVNMAAPMSAEETAQYWQNFINGHIPNFNKSPIEQLDNYVRDCWDAIVETAVWAQKDLPNVLERVRPDLICVDNVILFPAIKQFGKPWVRIISCSENELPDDAIPPHLSGCGENDQGCFRSFEAKFHEIIQPIHERFNQFLKANGEQPYPLGQFFEASPYLNLLLYPEAVKFKRSQPLDPRRFQYLEGCVRQEQAYSVPRFKKNEGSPLIYVSFGSLGTGDVATLGKLVRALGNLPVRALVNVGGYLDEYKDVPENVILEKWFPQPSVIPQVDGVIHHGGNNTFTECLYFGKPAIIMPYVWDGHDNATRVHGTGHGIKMHRSHWSETELAGRLNFILHDQAMKQKLAATAAVMRKQPGPEKAARLLNQLLTGKA